MKRLTALALCLTTVFTLGTSVSAADTLSSTTAGSNTSSQQVKGTYRDDTNATVYSVDIEWSDFNFEYNKEAKEHGIQLLINIQNQNQQVGEIRRVRSR